MLEDESFKQASSEFLVLVVELANSLELQTQVLIWAACADGFSVSTEGKLRELTGDELVSFT